MPQRAKSRNTAISARHRRAQTAATISKRSAAAEWPRSMLIAVAGHDYGIGAAESSIMTGRRPAHKHSADADACIDRRYFASCTLMT